MKELKISPWMKRAGTVFVDLIYTVVCFFIAFFFSSFIADYIFRIQESGGSLPLTRDGFIQLIAGFGFIFLLMGIFLGRATRTHSVFHDLKNVNDPVTFAELNAAVKQYGMDKGWLKK